jgi:BirA family biotin operon repressor/biotin-[acetyl-CoA-carboxylase] ligase
VRTAPLDWQRIAAEAGVEVVWHPETGSTNDDARQIALAGAAHGTVVIADTQRFGRGRRGSVWVSPPQRNLLCSVVLRPTLPVEKWARLTHACALAVCDALEILPDLPPPQIKWPNDVYLRGRKVCGILVESTLDVRGGFVVAGAGVNLNLTSEEFPAELRETATSVWLERGGQPVSREDFAIQFLRRLRAQCLRAEQDFPALLADCESRSYLNGKRVTLVSGGETMEGTVTGSGSEGELQLVDAGGRTKLVTSADFVRLAGEPF